MCVKNVSSHVRRVWLAAAEIDEDSVTSGELKCYQATKASLAEKRGVEEGKEKKEKGSQGSQSRICAGEDTDTDLSTSVIMIIRP